MNSDVSLIELDGRHYVFDHNQGSIELVEAAVSNDASVSFKEVVTDFGVIPHLIEVAGKPKYLKSILARQLRDSGEAMTSSLVLVDSQHRLDDHCSLLLYQVADRPSYSRYSRLVDDSSEPCLLHSLSSLYVAAALKHKKGCSMLLFVHHGIFDIVAVDKGAIVGFRRVTGMMNGSFKEDRLPYFADQVASIQQHIRVPLEQLVVYQFLAEASCKLDWTTLISQRLGLPLVKNSAPGIYHSDNNSFFSDVLPLITDLSYQNSSSSRKNKILAATVSYMPRVALALFLANAAIFSVFALNNLDTQLLTAQIEVLNTDIEKNASIESIEIPDYQPLLASLQTIEAAVNTPSYDLVLNEIVTALNDEIDVKLDAIYIDYKMSPIVNSRVGKTSVSTSGNSPLIVDLMGSLEADSIDAMDAFNRITSRLGGVGYVLLDSDIKTGQLMADFAMKLERRK
jgi:hypothetical protein